MGDLVRLDAPLITEEHGCHMWGPLLQGWLPQCKQPSLTDPSTQTLCQQTSPICSLPIKCIWLLHESPLHRLEWDFVAVKPFFEVAVSEATRSSVIRDKANTGRQSAACEPLQRNNNALGTCSFEKMRAHHISKDITVNFLCQLSNQEDKATVCTKFNDVTLLRSA